MAAYQWCVFAFFLPVVVLETTFGLHIVVLGNARRTEGNSG